MKPDATDGLPRRHALRLALAGALIPTASCSWLFRHKDLQPICPNAPEVSFPGGPLTIDAHCHVFNGTDLQVEEFLSRIAVKQGGLLGAAARALGELLESLAWKYAPSGEQEIEKLREVAAALQTCTASAFAGRVGALRQDGYDRGRGQLLAAVEKSGQLRAMRSRRALGTLSVAPDSDDAARLEALAIIESLPDRVDQYQTMSEQKALRIQSAMSVSVQGLIDFVLQNFQYRYVSVHDYLRTYNRPGWSTSCFPAWSTTTSG